LLYAQSGLLGVSGISSDMRALLASSDLQAREAIALFVFRMAREIGALTSSLGGLDGLVFTAGIGEHAPAIRAMVCERLSWLGAKIDPIANTRNDFAIGTSDSRVAIHVIPTNEELMIARHTLEAIAPQSSQ
jgi:acetate kinase